jgi:DNA (cytosine-5)-methyltransferase 1
MTFAFPLPALRPARGAEIIVDSFAGGGGASTGIFQALGRHPDVAINHDPEAVAMHAANHPGTVHYCQSIYRADPRDVAAGRPVGLLWASPDCKHFSKAKGGQPLSRNIRDLAWVVVHYAERVAPRVIILENVEEFQDWGPLIAKRGADGAALVKDGRPVMVPDPARRGETFRRWVGALRRLGYRVAWRELRACDYGAPTIRKRLFVIARRDELPIVWPTPTHGAGLIPYRTAADIIDWSLPCPSIFLTREEARVLRVKRPLEEATMRRIALGVKRFVLDAAEPFIVTCNHGGGGFRGRGLGESMHTITASRDADGLVVPVIAGCGGRAGQSPPRPGGAPVGTLTAKADQILISAHVAQVAAFMAQHNTDMVGHSVRKPVSTIVGKGSTQALVAGHLARLKGTCRDGHPATAPLATLQAEGNHIFAVYSFLVKYYGTAIGIALDEPVHTDTTKPRFGVVTVPALGSDYVLADIGMRMLTPRERFRAQGFPDTYVIDVVHNGKVLTQDAQGRMCGNSVSPPLARALVGANVPELACAREAAE